MKKSDKSQATLVCITHLRFQALSESARRYWGWILLQSTISSAFPQLFLHLPSTHCQWVEHFQTKAFGIILKKEGVPHVCSDARGWTVFSLRCGLTQQFCPAQLLFYTIPFFIPFAVDSGL